MRRCILAVLALAAVANAQPNPWLYPTDDDLPIQGSGSSDLQLQCPFDGKLGSTFINTIFMTPSGIVTGEEIDGYSNLKDGDEYAYNEVNSWFIAPLYASYRRYRTEMSCWKVSQPMGIADVVRNMAPDFEPSATVAATWSNLELNDQDYPFDVQLVLTSDENGNAFAVFSYKRDDEYIITDWRDSIKRLAVKLPSGVLTEYVNAADVSNLFGNSNYEPSQCCMFVMRIGDASSDMSKPVLPGSCDCAEGEQCVDDKATLRQTCSAQEAPPVETAPTEECGTLAQCNPNAQCNDQDGTRCCVCSYGYWGNGAHCHSSSISETGLTPNFEARMWVDPDWISVGTSGSTIGLNSQITKGSIDSRYWGYAPVVLAIYPWLFSNPAGILQYTPSVLTGVNFNRSLEVQMTRGEESPVSFKLENMITSDLSNNYLQSDIAAEVEGDLSVPEFVSIRKLLFKYQHRQQGVINGAGLIVVVDANDVAYSYSWTETLNFFECGSNEHIGVTDRSVQVRVDQTAWSDDYIQFNPTIEMVDGGIEIPAEESQTGSGTPARDGSDCGECYGNRECRFNQETSQNECMCPDGYTDYGDSSASCEPRADPCGGQCDAERATVCGPESTCVCRDGYEPMEGSDPLTCTQPPTETCTQSCHEQANCTQVSGQWQCVCQGDYVGNGTHCELACTARPDACNRLNERCSPASKRCECRAGFKLYKDKRGSFCVNAQSCVHTKCRSNMQCVRRDDYNHECICKRDNYYDGSNCVAYTPSTDLSSDWMVYAHGVIIARGRPDNRGNIASPWPLVVISDQRAVAVATDCSSGAVYWSDVKNKVIRRAFMNAERITHEVVLALPRVSSVEGMAFDHVSKNLYYTDAGTDSVVVFNVMNNKTKTIATSTSDPRGITLDLVNNKVYWVDWDATNPRVERANLDGSGRMVIVTNSAGAPVKYPNGIYVDGFKHLLYWADAGTGQVQKVSTAGVGEPTVHFNLENYDRSWEEKRYMLFDITAVRTNEIYSTVWGVNGVMRTNDQRVFDKAPGGNGKIFGLDYYRATCQPTSSKCGLIQTEEGWKAEQCEKVNQMCFTLAHTENPSCVCADDATDC